MSIFGRIRKLLDAKYDLAREETEEQTRQRLRKEWKAEQEATKKATSRALEIRQPRISRRKNTRKGT